MAPERKTLNDFKIRSGGQRERVLDELSLLGPGFPVRDSHRSGNSLPSQVAFPEGEEQDRSVNAK